MENPGFKGPAGSAADPAKPGLCVADIFYLKVLERRTASFYIYAYGPDSGLICTDFNLLRLFLRADSKILT